jgi:hypothetical protein
MGTECAPRAAERHRQSNRSDRPSQESEVLLNAPDRPLGARGPVTGREFDSSQAGGPIRRLSTGRIQVTYRGVDAVERHIGRFGNDEANQVMVERLRRISSGDIQPTPFDLNFYAHELREFVG